MAGRTGVFSRSFSIVYRDLLAASGCDDHNALTVAEREIRSMAAEGILGFKSARRDSSAITTIELNSDNETLLYEATQRHSPSQKRTDLANVFHTASAFDVPEKYREGWVKLCNSMALAATNGRSVLPFNRGNLHATSELLKASANVLGWNTDSLVRFASCQIFRNSKRLEELRIPIESVIALATERSVTLLSQLGILDNPRYCHFSGPAIFHFPEGIINFGSLHAPRMISIVDLKRCTKIETSALRFCSVENLTSFHELAKPDGDTLLACTEGYAGSALLIFISKLPEMEKYHFGDSDPAGFDILADLRARSGDEIGSLHMTFRNSADAQPFTEKDMAIAERVLKSIHLTNSEKSHILKMTELGDKGIYEQEMLGVPSQRHWPYY